MLVGLLLCLLLGTPDLRDEARSEAALDRLLVSAGAPEAEQPESDHGRLGIRSCEAVRGLTTGRCFNSSISCACC